MDARESRLNIFSVWDPQSDNSNILVDVLMIVQGNSVDFGYARLCNCAFRVGQSADRSHA